MTEISGLTALLEGPEKNELHSLRRNTSPTHPSGKLGNLHISWGNPQQWQAKIIQRSCFQNVSGSYNHVFDGLQQVLFGFWFWEK